MEWKQEEIMRRVEKGKYCKIHKKRGKGSGAQQVWTSAAWAAMVGEEDKRSETEREAQRL